MIVATEQVLWILHTMKSLWLELNYYQNFKMEYSEDIVKLQKLLKGEGSFNSNRSQCLYDQV